MRMQLHIGLGFFARAARVDVRKPAQGCSRLFKKKYFADILIIVGQACFSGRRTEAPD